MPLTNAQRQAAWRGRRQEAGAEWVRMPLGLPAKRALERLARHYGVTERVVLERVLAEAQSHVLDGLDSAGQAHYYRDGDVTA
jgi:hypothetical protein